MDDDSAPPVKTTRSPLTWGVLEKTAPGLAGALRRAFPPAAALEVAATYAEVLERSGLESPSIDRPEGASFNPRPARICQILMTDGGGSTPEELQLAVRLSIPRRGDPPQLPPPPNPSDRVALALAIDDVRHLHMTDPAERDHHAVLAAARALVGLSTAPQRLKVVLEHAVRRYARLSGGSRD